MLGDGRLALQCFDNKARTGLIRGTMRRRVWINTGDIVLVGLREFQPDKADVIHKYSTEVCIPPVPAHARPWPAVGCWAPPRSPPGTPPLTRLWDWDCPGGEGGDALSRWVRLDRWALSLIPLLLSLFSALISPYPPPLSHRKHAICKHTESSLQMLASIKQLWTWRWTAARAKKRTWALTSMTYKRGTPR